MDKALVFGTKDCRFESCQGQRMQREGHHLGGWVEVNCKNATAECSSKTLYHAYREGRSSNSVHSTSLLTVTARHTSTLGVSNDDSQQ